MPNHHVLVTGSRGMLGHQIAKKFFKNDDVYVLTRSTVDLVSNPQGFVNLLMGEKPDIIVHCAAHVGGLLYNMTEPAQIVTDNLMITANFIWAVNQYIFEGNNLEKLVIIGSSCAYPGSPCNSLREVEYTMGSMDKDTQFFAISKRAALTAQIALEKQNGIKWLHPIPSNMYGEGDKFNPERGHALAAIIGKVVNAKDEKKKELEMIGTGRVSRDFIFSEDVADAVIALSLSEHTGVFNVGSGQGTFIVDLAEMIADIVGWDGKFIWQKQPDYDGIEEKTLNIDKIKTAIGWEQKYTLKEGLKKTIAWHYQNHCSP